MHFVTLLHAFVQHGLLGDCEPETFALCQEALLQSPLKLTVSLNS